MQFYGDCKSWKTASANSRTRTVANAKIGREPQPIGAILAELFAHYQARFPEVRIAVVKTPAVAV